MKSEHANIVLISCLCLIGVGIALLIAAVATTHWVVITTLDGGDATLGLFKICQKGACIVYDEHSRFKVGEHLKKVRGLCVTAIILYGFAFITMMVVALQRHTLGSKTIGKVCYSLSIVGGILALAGMGHFIRRIEGGDADKDTYKYGYSLHLVWLSVIPAMIFGVMANIVVNHFFKSNQITTGQVIQGPPPSYAQNVMVHHPGMMNQPYTLSYDNQVMMSNMTPGHGQNAAKQGPPSDISGGHLGSGSP